MNSKHIKVKVFPDQPNEKIVANVDLSFDVYLREPAKAGMANRRLLAIIIEQISPKPKRVKIVSGFTSPAKIIEAKW